MTIDEHALLRSASRTFALSIERLPGVVGEAMCLAYLLLRVSDFLEDNDYMPPERKAVQTQLLVHVRNSTQGMARWVARGPQNIIVETDMDDYMHEVAGRVGYL